MINIVCVYLLRLKFSTHGFVVLKSKNAFPNIIHLYNYIQFTDDLLHQHANCVNHCTQIIVLNHHQHYNNNKFW